jgi:hypothetical protein
MATQTGSRQRNAEVVLVVATGAEDGASMSTSRGRVTERLRRRNDLEGL